MAELNPPDTLEMGGTFTLTEIDPPSGKRARQFVGILTRAPVPVAGYGGWSRVARPRRKALTEWVGRDSLSLEISFILDSYDTGQGLYVETKCQILDELAGIEQHDPEPPLLRLESNPAPLMPHGFHRASHVKWFIETLTWEADQVRYNREGNRLRAAGSMTVTQYVDDAKLASLSSVQARRNAASRKDGKAGGKLKTYTVRAGDTLSKIAARKDVYGDASKWKKIASANSIRDPKKLKVGKVLKIP